MPVLFQRLRPLFSVRYTSPGLAAPSRWHPDPQLFRSSSSRRSSAAATECCPGTSPAWLWRRRALDSVRNPAQAVRTQARSAPAAMLQRRRRVVLSGRTLRRCGRPRRARKARESHGHILYFSGCSRRRRFRAGAMPARSDSVVSIFAEPFHRIEPGR